MPNLCCLHCACQKFMAVFDDPPDKSQSCVHLARGADLIYGNTSFVSLTAIPPAKANMATQAIKSHDIPDP